MKRLALIFALSWVTVAATHADEVLLGRIPISGVTVRGVEGCEVIYTMSGSPTNRPADRVILHLDAMPALERAEVAAAEQRPDEAMTLLDEALGQAREPWQKLWVNYRRTRLLTSAGRYTQACGSWATLLLTSVDPCWVDAMPACPPDHPDEATKSTTLAQLNKALAQFKEESVASDMIALAIRTISDLDTSKAAPTGEAPAEEDVSPGEAPGNDESPATPQAAATRTIADDIDAMLAAGRTDHARQEIEKWVADTRQYPLDRLLYQYGRVLAAQGKPRDAAVRFMQCAILYGESSFAAASLFETARLYAGPLSDPAAARSLLQRAGSAADPDRQADLLEKIRAALAELGHRK